MDTENITCIYTEKPICTDADVKSQSIPTTNLSNNRNFNYTQGSYYTVTELQTSSTNSINSVVNYKYSRLLAKILDVAFVNKNLDILSDEQLKLILKLNDASYNTFTMPLDVKQLDQFLGAFREYS
jgi:hypothetical protein